MFLYILLILSNHLLPCNTDELLTIDLRRVKDWASEFNSQIELINSVACVNQIQRTYEAKAEIVTIKPSETLKNAVEGINKLFTNKNNTLHKLVDDAQFYAAEYSRQVFNRDNETESDVNLKSNHSVGQPPDAPITAGPEVNHLTTESAINQNLSTFYKSIDFPNGFAENNRSKYSPNEVYNGENEYRQITTAAPSGDGDEAVEDQAESSNKLEEEERFSYEGEYRRMVVSEEETMREQLEIDKKINESLNRANYLTTTPRTVTDLDAEKNDKETNEVIDKEDIDAIARKEKNETETDAEEEEDEDLLEFKDFLYFVDTKKMYSPDKPLSNMSIPRQVPEDLNELKELDKDEKREMMARWKTWTPVKTIKHGLFPNYRLNFSFSSLHIPLNVYPQQDAIRHAIKWSDRLDETFKENRKADPFLSFQFYCSNDGFLRTFPAHKWRVPELFRTSEKFLDDDELEEFQKEENGFSNVNEEISDEEVNDNDPSMALDLYDCRLRDWYIKAAAAPKDVIVLMDSSGSMRGERSIIAENVLINILDTLTENDYVSLIRFNNETHPVEDCFNMDFVQANRRNVEKFKARILELGHQKQLDEAKLRANYSGIIEVAFELLKKEKKGSNCNKLMMIVTDGDLDNLDDLLSRLNDDDSIRVFSFLVGGEVISSPNTESIACKNHGYFTHLKDLAEVKEEVQLYVPVLSRSIGLRLYDPDAKMTTTFSSIYSDQVLLSLTDMTWEKNENKLLEKYEFKTDPDKVEPELMITMSMPVFNLTNGTQTSWDLIGVAGLDVPISEILNEIPFYRLGVNSHAFIINNNGYLVYHPDMRPLYKGFLKSFYTSLDLLEVELVDDGKEARDENKQLLHIRKSMINGELGCEELDGKFHYNSMTRASTRKQLICWRPIPNTLFSIAISIPANYGPYIVKAPFKVKPNVDYSGYFDLEGSQWSVHPKWTYCWDNLYNAEVNSDDRTEKILLEMTPKEIIEHFLKMNQLDSDSFSLQDYLFNEEDENLNSKFFCNEELLSALVFDANSTRIKLGSCSTAPPNEQLNLKPINAFLTTKSGLTRYFDFNEAAANSSTGFKRELAINENIYKRAVDYSIKYESNHFIFQLEKDGNRSFITAARALVLVHTDTGRKKNRNAKPSRVRTPYAVIGMQFDYEAFLNSIKRPNFSSQRTRSYFLDDNGYVMFGFDEENQLISDASKDDQPSGLLFSEYDSDLFEHLINQSVYRRIKIFDYQGICETRRDPDSESSSFSLSVQPTLVNLLFKSLFSVINEFAFAVSFWLSSLAVRPVRGLEEDDDADGYYVAPLPNRTQVQSCRKDHIFYELNRELSKSVLSKEPKLHSFQRANGPDHYIIYKLKFTNLILVITSDEYEPRRESYAPKVSVEKDKCDRDTFHRRAPYIGNQGPVCYPNENEKSIQACGASPSSGLKIKCNQFILFSITIFSLCFRHFFKRLNSIC